MIIDSKELAAVRADHKDQTIALRLGCYDILHYGHQKGIDFAASQAEILAIGVMSDEYIEERKGRISINGVEDRIKAIDVAPGVNYSFVMSNVGMRAVMRTLLQLHPDVYVEGDEHGAKASRSLLLGALGVKYVVDHVSKVASSSDIISQLGSTEAARVSGLDFQPTIAFNTSHLPTEI